jgi:hypothetical protein
MAIQPGNREETVETIELRGVVSEYDELTRREESRPLTPQEQHDHDELHAILLLEEEEYWQGASPLAVDILRDATEIDFPMIRYTLGLLDHQFES